MTETKTMNKTHRNTLFVGVILAIIITVLITTAINTQSERINDIMVGDQNVLNAPTTVNALLAAQDAGVVVAIHGWSHENYSTLTPEEITTNMEKGKAVFQQAGFTGNMFVIPYGEIGFPKTKAQTDALNASGLTIDTVVVDEYTWLWRNMTSYEDSRYLNASVKMNEQQPVIVALHAQDWNEYTRQAVVNYLINTEQKDVIVRIDDVVASTSVKDINEMAELKKYNSVAQVIIAVIPATSPMVEHPTVFGIEISKIMGVYFALFVGTVLFPTALIISWKIHSDWYVARRNKKEPKSFAMKKVNLVSIIVPAYNEEVEIEKCVKSMLHQDYGGKLEVIVVNDGSKDRTAEIVARMPVNLIDLKKNVGKANALNIGIEHAKGDIILFSDGDSNMERGAVRSIIRTFAENPSASIVTGTVLINPVVTANPLKKAFMYCQMIEYHLEQELVRGLQALNGKVIVCPGPITAVRKEVLNSVQFSNDTIVEDADFTVTALKENMVVIRDANAKVYTDAPENITTWIKQRNRWWYGGLQVWKKHKSWAMRNPWMLYSYVGYITAIMTLITTVTMPLLLMQYENTTAAAIHTVIYIAIPIAIYIGFNSIFLSHDKKLIPMLAVYMVFYTMLRLIVCSYLYILYITGIGLRTQFGANKTRVK